MSYSYAVGRRKSSTATVKFFPSGTGQILIKKPNKSEVSLKDYFGGNTHMAEKALMPIDILNDASIKKGDFHITIIGGGLAGQADAIKLGIARALIKHNPALRLTLKPYGTLKRDARIKERKKFGFLKARKKPKRSKR